MKFFTEEIATIIREQSLASEQKGKLSAGVMNEVSRSAKNITSLALSAIKPILLKSFE